MHLDSEKNSELPLRQIVKICIRDVENVPSALSSTLYLKSLIRIKSFFISSFCRMEQTFVMPMTNIQV